MRVRIELTDTDEEIVIHCRQITPEIETLVQSIRVNRSSGTSIAFFKNDEQYYLHLSEVLFFITEGDKIFAHTASDAYETRTRLYELEKLLPPSFVRVSKSSITNTLQIFSIQRNLTRIGVVSFRGSHKEIYVSRMYSKLLQQKMEERHLYEKK